MDIQSPLPILVRYWHNGYSIDWKQIPGPAHTRGEGITQGQKHEDIGITLDSVSYDANLSKFLSELNERKRKSTSSSAWHLVKTQKMP